MGYGGGWMARVLFVSNPGTISHLNPLIGPAQRLREAGHEVAFVATTQGRADELAPYELTVLRTASEQPKWAPPSTIAHTTMGWYDDDHLVREALRQTMLRAAPALVDDIRALVRAFRPDVMAIDCVTYAGMIAAALEKVPCIGVDMALKTLTPPGLDFRFERITRSIEAERAEVFARYGLAPTFRLMECLSPYENAVFSTRALVGEVPASVRLVGPSLSAGTRGDVPRGFAFDRVDATRPLVYVSLGTLVWKLRPDIFSMVAAASRGLGVQVVMAVGQAQVTSEDPHVLAVPYAPQLELLAKAAAFVTHGGGSSVMESLHYGVPMVLLPTMLDSPVQAHYVTGSGCGLAIEPTAITERSLRAALQAVLAPENGYRANAQRIQADYRAHDGARLLADALLARARAGHDDAAWRS
jgi:zeaxanthin glucosyltransferase